MGHELIVNHSFLSLLASFFPCLRFPFFFPCFIFFFISILPSSLPCFFPSFFVSFHPFFAWFLPLLVYCLFFYFSYLDSLLPFFFLPSISPCCIFLFSTASYFASVLCCLSFLFHCSFVLISFLLPLFLCLLASFLFYFLLLQIYVPLVILCLNFLWNKIFLSLSFFLFCSPASLDSLFASSLLFSPSFFASFLVFLYFLLSFPLLFHFLNLTVDGVWNHTNKIVVTNVKCKIVMNRHKSVLNALTKAFQFNNWCHWLFSEWPCRTVRAAWVFGGVLWLIVLMRVEVHTERLFLSCLNEGLSWSTLRGCESGWPVCAVNE